MGSLFTRARAEAYRATLPTPAIPTPRKLSGLQWAICAAIWLCLAPLLLVAFLLLGERPRRAVPRYEQRPPIGHTTWYWD